MCRKRYIDDQLINAVSKGIDAVVILGAGYDTRAYRMWSAGSPYGEPAGVVQGDRCAEKDSDCRVFNQCPQTGLINRAPECRLVLDGDDGRHCRADHGDDQRTAADLAHSEPNDRPVTASAHSLLLLVPGLLFYGVSIPAAYNSAVTVAQNVVADEHRGQASGIITSAA